MDEESLSFPLKSMLVGVWAIGVGLVVVFLILPQFESQISSSENATGVSMFGGVGAFIPIIVIVAIGGLIMGVITVFITTSSDDGEDDEDDSEDIYEEEQKDIDTKRHKYTTQTITKTVIEKPKVEQLKQKESKYEISDEAFNSEDL